jgi:hypothetical protein
MATLARAECFILTCLGCGARRTFPVDLYDDRGRDTVQPEVKAFAASHRGCPEQPVPLLPGAPA